MTTSILERLESMSIPEPMSGCWLWLKAVNSTHRRHPGYRSAQRPVMRFNGKTVSASRVTWMAYNGEIPAGLSVCHHCDNSLCVNPDHLYVATHQQNMHDAQRRGRLAGNGNPQGENCSQGHPFTPENTRWRANRGRPLRVCRTSDRIAYAKINAQPRTTLTPADVMAIRASHESAVVVGERYGLHSTTIRNIKTYRSWKHLP